MNRVRAASPAGCACVLLVLVGCASKPVPVEGIVTLDGQPVDGASVTFVSEDGNRSYSGFTDSGGKFSLSSGDVVGALPGNYKVTVIKTAKKTTAQEIDPMSADAMKIMKKDSEGAAKASSSSGAADMMKAKMMGKGGAMPMPGAGGSVKSELPAMYAGSTSPLTAKVPPDGNLVKIELKSKP